MLELSDPCQKAVVHVQGSVRRPHDPGELELQHQPERQEHEPDAEIVPYASSRQTSLELLLLAQKQRVGDGVRPRDEDRPWRPGVEEDEPEDGCDVSQAECETDGPGTISPGG